MNLKDVVQNRRSARNFLSREIPEETLQEILEAGRLAPSAGNGQNHFFGVIKDADRKQQLAEAAGGQSWIATAPVVIALCSYIGHDMAKLPEDDFGLIVNKLRFGEDFLSYLNQYEDRRGMDMLWQNGCTLIPGEHIFLAAASHGISGCWIGYLDTRKASRILNLPEDMNCFFLMPLGYPAEEPGEILRKSFDEVVFFEQWKQK